MEEKNIKKIVRESYAKIASGSSCCSGPATSSCCGGQVELVKEISSNIGYSKEDLNKVPEGSNLGLGCGNPIAVASLSKGAVVLDLGSGQVLTLFWLPGKLDRKAK